jgi:hypothetical protein
MYMRSVDWNVITRRITVFLLDSLTMKMQALCSFETKQTTPNNKESCTRRENHHLTKYLHKNVFYDTLTSAGSERRPIMSIQTNITRCWQDDHQAVQMSELTDVTDSSYRMHCNTLHTTLLGQNQYHSSGLVFPTKCYYMLYVLYKWFVLHIWLYVLYKWFMFCTYGCMFCTNGLCFVHMVVCFVYMVVSFVYMVVCFVHMIVFCIYGCMFCIHGCTSCTYSCIFCTYGCIFCTYGCIFSHMVVCFVNMVVCFVYMVVCFILSSTFVHWIDGYTQQVSVTDFQKKLRINYNNNYWCCIWIIKFCSFFFLAIKI